MPANSPPACYNPALLKLQNYTLTTGKSQLRKQSPVNPAGRGLNYQGASFYTSAATLAQCPPDEGREAAFIGRSNAGKSSAINALTRQNRLARTSKTPGRTQLLNFFQVAEGRFLVDLPGFGYAKVPLEVKHKWQLQLERYLSMRQSLQGVVLLMDIRHPFKDFDRLIIEWATRSALPMHILLTKADKLKSGQAKSTLATARREVAPLGEGIEVQLFSATKREGVEQLQNRLDEWLDPEAADTGYPPEEPGTAT